MKKGILGWVRALKSITSRLNGKFGYFLVRSGIKKLSAGIRPEAGYIGVVSGYV